ncbi:N-acetyl-gamma-glutamyl-phosphate reductase [Eilatimonas milleporae]|uniref:N-acetyl-gamma-glutamyl-phosphate reductase n=1 Tax=Eilatimonas milleporae TaxID=911205 RepID=A0A3M0CPE6_9PROT|nr:N-acetyl-gamma-glutamyl-phosphate reductase [Eilatimonas milleporae]RMB08646.1 N-acetyl-gamma-glutamyl-phosphate reductase [Eilatimonas milleporae]
MSDTVRVGILGASGYTGGDLIRLLAGHPKVEIALLTAERHAGASVDSVWPHLRGAGELPALIALEDVEWPAVELDVIFCALPHATSQDVIKGLLHATGHSLLEEMIAESPGDLAESFRGEARIIDLSADFRLRDVETYERWYGQAHQAPDLQAKAVYGLPELYGADIRDARLVACPGCYPTAALLALVPLIRAGLVETDDIIIDAKSGVTGAGRGLKQQMLFSEVSEALHPYGVGHHRHMPEIDQELSVAAGKPVTVSFTPHLVPINRGELETIYVRLRRDARAADLRMAWENAYGDAPFVSVLDDDAVPATRMVRGSNQCILGAVDDRIDGRAIVIAAIDNLVKGSSGQAVQVMNLMLGFEETDGLTQLPLFP